MDLQFTPARYGPYSDRLRHLLDALDGTYLLADKRLADAGPPLLDYRRQHSLTRRLRERYMQRRKTQCSLYPQENKF